MRIALVAPLVSPIREPNVGGAQVVVSDLATELVRRGHEVVMYAAQGSSVDGVDLAPVAVDPLALRADVFRHGRDHVASAAMTQAYELIYGHVRQGAFDVVHNHGSDAPAISVPARIGLRALHTLHLPPSPAVVAALQGARRADAPVWCAAVSRAQLRTWQEHTAVDAVLPNGVPLSALPFAPGPGSGAVIAARFSAEKGITEGVSAARAADLQVDVYGNPYDPAYEEAVRARWRDDPAVTIHPPLARDQLWRALGAAAVVLCLSQWDEPFGMVAAEAQAAGTPVVASRRGGLPEVVDDGTTGFLVDDQPAAAAEAVRRASTLDRGECRQHAERTLGLAGSVDAHEELYSILRS